MIDARANTKLWQRAVSALLRIVLLVSAMLLMLGALLLGLLLTSGVVLWALLRGRRPGPVDIRWGACPARAASAVRPPAKWSTCRHAKCPVRDCAEPQPRRWPWRLILRRRK
jgi:hypothetical protein